MQANIDTQASDASSPLDISPPGGDSTDNIGDAERGLSLMPHSVPISVRSLVSTNPDDETELQPTPPQTGGYIRRKTSQIFKAVLDNGVVNLVANKNQLQNVPVAPALNILVDAYASSSIAAEIKADGEELRREVVRADNGHGNGNGSTSNELPDVILETSMLRGRKRATWGTQFRILSGRAFKNLYRDPALLTAHYTSAIALASMWSTFVTRFDDADPFFFFEYSHLWIILPQRHVRLMKHLRQG